MIFLAKKIGSVHIKGLVDSLDITQFDENEQKLFTKWRNSENTSKSDIEGFIDWFRRFKSPVVRDSMISCVREECGLGSPPMPFTTNASESANFLLKHKVDYKRNELPVFLDKLQELIKEQEREFEKAIIGRGKYELRTQYRSWHIPESKWFAMNSKQREMHLKKFAGASLNDIPECDAGIHIGRDASISSTLSVQLDTFADQVRVPRNCLEGIWNKAAEIPEASDSIVKAPVTTAN